VRILITGASGMLGATLASAWRDKYTVFATDHTNFNNNTVKNFKEFDLLSDSYEELINWSTPDVIIHCAAITNVDQCEEQPKQAVAVNAGSVKKLLQSINNNTKIIFISSEAVFSGVQHLASENDKTTPQTVYGESKVAAEKYLKEAGNSHLIIRTTIVGKNINTNRTGFVEWLVNSAKHKKEITLFDDVFFTPITIWDLMEELEWVLENNVFGTIHIAGKRLISKFEFGKQIYERLGFNASLIHKGSVDNVCFQAKRSKDMSIDSSYYHKLSKHSLPSIDKTVRLLADKFKESNND